jgi:branched-chain amino acid transport system permease protein
MTDGVLDVGKTVRAGVIAAVVLSFVAAVGMVETFNGRMIVDGLLSLGFLAAFWYVPVAAYNVSRQKVLEGVETHPAGTSNVVAGVLVGAIAGTGLWLFIVLVDSFDLREVFIRLSPELVRILTFDRGLGFGLAAILGICVLLGLIGGGLHLVSDTLRRKVVGAAEWVIAVALIEDVVSQIMRQIGLGSFATTIFTDGALRLVPAAVIAAVAFLFTARKRDRASSPVRAFLAPDDPKVRTRNSVIAAGALVVAIVVAPWLLGSIISELLANVGIFLLMALGLNIVVGFAGLLDLGYVAFFAVGAYTTGILSSPISPRFTPELPWWWTIPVVLVVAAISGLLVGTPVIRLRGDYLAIVTLGFGEIVRILALSDWLAPTFGGAQGIRNIPGIPLGFDTITGADPGYIMYFAAALVALAAWVSYALLNSRIGRAWTAMREDESVAEVMGIDTTRAKLSAFIVGAILASLGGSLFAAKVGSIFPNSFELLVSIIILVVVIVGGMGSIPGVAVGAVVLIGILGGPKQPGLLQEFSEFKLLIYGALLIYMMLQRPEGLIPSVRRQRELHGEESTQDAWFDKGGQFTDDDEPATAEEGA